MKKIELTEKQKKVLKTAVIAAGGTVCIVGGAKIISRTEVGSYVKERIIHRVIRSRAIQNGRDFQMYTWVSNKACPDKNVAEKAFREAYDLWKSIILAAKDAV